MNRTFGLPFEAPGPASATDERLIAVELVLIALWLTNLATGGREHLEALQTLMGGEYVVRFWVWFVLLGLATPLLLETWELLRKEKTIRALAVISPLLVLVGGYLLRQITVDVGQETTWVQYTEQFNTELLDRLRGD